MRTILFIIRKETLQVLRDRIMLVQIFVPPVLQLLILAQAMTFEVKHTDLALVDLDRSPASERLVERFTASGRFEVAVWTPSGDVADEALLTREASAVLRIPEGFERDLRRGQPPAVQLVLNAEDGAAAGVRQAYAAQILAAFTQAEAAGPIGASMRAATDARPGVAIQTRTLYNPEGAYLAYMAIGLLASLVTLVGILLTSQNIAREKEIGTLEQLNVTPITKRQFIVGKLAPFWVLGLIELTVGLLVIRLVFGIPFAGPVALVYLGAGVYLFAALGLGLLISTAVQTQQQAQFLTFFVLVTFFFLGGIFTPVQSMPGWAQTVAEFNPIKHFAALLRAVLIKGGGFGDVVGGIGAMAAFAVVVLTLALLRYRKTAA
ncbi:MAG: ABC transporter permease [Rhodothermaceae bacterium]|nr:ABC transporter permease [Rhodothermaceae bacterium]